MHIAICDDDVTALSTLVAIAQRWAKGMNVRADIGTYQNAESFLITWPPPYPYDIVILDVVMGRMNGVDLAATIRETDPLVCVIFVSGMRDYSSKGYKVNAMRYIYKPIRWEDCEEALNEAYKRAKTRSTYAIVVPASDGIARLSVNEIVHISTVPRHDVIVETVDGRAYRFRGTLRETVSMIPVEARHYFYDCHKSHVVNLMHVETIRAP